LKLEGKKTLVLGAGKSGIASARFLAKRGATVALHDRKPVDDWTEEARSLKTEKVGLLDGQIPSWLLDQIDLVIISPGIPTNTVPARYVDRKDGEVIGEVELAYRFLKGRIVGITGSNGKTTTTTLIGEILKDAGIETQIGGNIGTPLIDLVETSTDETWTVCELSSFQLETIKAFSLERRRRVERHAESSRPLRFFFGLRGSETSPFYESNGGRCRNLESRRQDYGELGGESESAYGFVFGEKRVE
jgi:UDP-N-acetylmuramoylalanine--D-glutamate ligase